MRGAGRRIAGWSAVVLLVVIVGLAAGPGSRGGPAFDPRSASGNGTKALVLLLGELGGRVDVTADVPGPATTVAVVLHDQLSDDRRSALSAWARAGGTLVVADPTSPLRPSDTTRLKPAVGLRLVSGPCPVPGLEDVSRVATGGSDLLIPPPAAVGCFPAGGGDLLVSRSFGQGRLTVLGGAGPFTNTELATQDNSVLAVDLLIPRPGARISIMLPTPVGGGQRSLWQLLGRPRRLALIELLVAFAVMAAGRAYRLGRPVTEQQPVNLAGSELTVAVGNLMARAKHRDVAAARLRAGLRRWLGRRLGLGPAATDEQLVDAASARAGVDGAALRAVLAGAITSDAELVHLAAAIEGIRHQVES